MAASYKNKKGGRALSTKSKAKDSKKKLGENLVYDFVKVTGLIPAMIIMRPRIIHVGKHKSLRGGYLASANHCSFLDPIFLQERNQGIANIISPYGRKMEEDENFLTRGLL